MTQTRRNVFSEGKGAIFENKEFIYIYRGVKVTSRVEYALPKDETAGDKGWRENGGHIQLQLWFSFWERPMRRHAIGEVETKATVSEEEKRI